MKSAASLPLFQSDERWCAAGDSLTQGGRYHEFVHLYWATRQPHHRLELYNCGINGDTTARVLTRLDADVLHLRPTLVTLLLGVNDVSPAFTGPNPEQIREDAAKAVAVYRDGVRTIVQRILATGARVLLITPGLYDETLVHPKAAVVRPGMQATLLQCGAAVHEVAAEFGLPVIDWTRPLMDWNAQLQKDDPSATLIDLDRTHPGELGSFVMAYEFLKGQNVPAEISRIAVNANTGPTSDVINCAISNFQKKPGSIEFDADEKSLPFPIPESLRSTLAYKPFVERFNRQTLKIEGLPSGTYQLRIDNQPIQNYTAEQLQAGINLAQETATPQYQQAMAVAELIARRSEIFRTKLRTIAEMEWSFLKGIDPSTKTIPELKTLLDDNILKFKIDHKMADTWYDFIKSQATRYLESKPNQAALKAEAADLLPQIDRANKPKPHHFEIAPVTGS